MGASMIRCDKCKINISGTREYCPLCGKKLADLNGIEDFEIFPVIPLKKEYQLFLRIVIFLSLSLMLVVEVVNHVFVPQFNIATIVCVGIACADLILYIAYKKRRNIRKAVMYESVVGSILIVLTDWYLGWHGWSVSYVVPLVVVSLNILYFVLSLIDREHQMDYGIYFLLTIIGTALVWLLLLLDIITNAKLASTTAGIGTILLLAEIIFYGQSFKAELSRRLHL